MSAVKRTGGMNQTFVFMLVGKLSEERAPVDQGVTGFVQPEIVFVDVAPFQVGNIDPAQNVLAAFGSPAIDIVSLGDILVRAR